MLDPFPFIRCIQVFYSIHYPQQVCIWQLLDSRHHVAGLRSDTVRAQPVVSSHTVRVRTDPAGGRVGSHRTTPAASVSSRRLSGNGPGTQSR